MNICKKIIININELKFNNVINKCPAIKFAVNRIDNDNGRIKILVVSINTINGVNIIGVFKGIKCAIIFLKFVIVDIIIKNNQNGIAKVNENTIWLEDEKIYGNKLIKLLKKINMNNLINKNEIDLKFLFL